MNFADRLDHALREVGHPALLGLDPHLEFLPEPFAGARDTGRPREERARLVADFCFELLDLAAGRVAAVKPQSAFFEELGAPGVAAWERVVAEARRRGLLVIGDVKRGDIASTAAAYARAFLGSEDEPEAEHLCDAITVNPYLGADSIEPLVERCAASGRGLFVLVRTSNPSSTDFQTHGDPPLWTRVAERVREWGEPLRGECGLSSIGAVVGATHSADLRDFRVRLPETPLLLPGYGAQGATAADLGAAFLDGGRGALVNSSRAIAFAYRNRPGLAWKDAAREALDEMIAELRAVVRGVDPVRGA